MLTGRVVRFDDTRGYGFITPDDGGEDIFMHANALIDEKRAFAPGVPVEFESTDSDRGRKAVAVRLRAGKAPTMAIPTDDDGLCDVLSAEAFTHQVTELLLREAPDLTAEQIVRLRTCLAAFATRYGWVEG